MGGGKEIDDDVDMLVIQPTTKQGENNNAYESEKQ